MNSLWLPKFLYVLPFLLVASFAACSKAEEKKEPPPPPKVHEVVAEPTPVVQENPFAKYHSPPPSAIIQVPAFDDIGGEFKLNDDWSFYTWKDTANNVICYIYIVSKSPAESGMSCVKI